MAATGSSTRKALQRQNRPSRGVGGVFEKQAPRSHRSRGCYILPVPMPLAAVPRSCFVAEALCIVAGGVSIKRSTFVLEWTILPAKQLFVSQKSVLRYRHCTFVRGALVRRDDAEGSYPEITGRSRRMGSSASSYCPSIVNSTAISTRA